MKVFVQLCVLFVLIASNGADVTADGGDFIFLSAGDDLVQFWSLNGEGHIISVGGLPAAFGLDDEVSPDWLVRDQGAFQVNAEKTLIAFTAYQSTSDTYALFLYRVADGYLSDPVRVPFWGSISWAPNGQSLRLLLRPRQRDQDNIETFAQLAPEQQWFLFDVDEQQTGLIPVPVATEQAGGIWLPDSSGFFMLSDNNIYIVNRDYSAGHRLNNPPLEELGPWHASCGVVWWPSTQKFYQFYNSCESRELQLYSVDLDGNSNQEIVFLEQLYDIVTIDMVDINVRQHSLYIGMGLMESYDEYSSGASIVVFQLSATGNTERVFYRPNTSINIRQIELSPDEKYMTILGSHLGPDYETLVVEIIDLETQETLAVLSDVAGEADVCDARWLGNDTIFYQLGDEYCNDPELAEINSTFIYHVTTDISQKLNVPGNIWVVSHENNN
ncbi:MAG: hypothetical protein H6670_14090 [Anaerolineaceae bacterium]|nr:hypothetical protein [Anaerolineaceae bacterium]